MLAFIPTSKDYEESSLKKIACAAGSQITADAAARVAGEGGNAVDAAIAATIVSMCTDIGIMSPGGGAFLTIWPAGGEPVVIDAFAEMPGRDLSARERAGVSVEEVVVDYGLPTVQRVGWGTIATPGAFAGLAMASQRYGRRPWPTLLQPAIDLVEAGFPLTGGAAEYLGYTHEAIYSWHPTSASILHHADGKVLAEGDTVHIPDLADTLRQIADDPQTLYGGKLGQRIAEGVRAQGGLLGPRDMASYRALERVPVTGQIGDWEIASNPPPALGGACLVAMLELMDGLGPASDPESLVDLLVTSQHAVLGYRIERLDGAGPRLSQEVSRLLDKASKLDPQFLQSPSTSHVSVVDDGGLSCSVTSSAGYGSGAIVEGTGFLLNNSLGEVDLHPRGLAGLEPGSRLPSNMAPTIARRQDGTVLAIGSPGASRITTAIAQVLLHFGVRGCNLHDAVHHPRLHVEALPDEQTIAFEPGLPVRALRGLAPRPFDAPSMYFGGVQAALWSPESGAVAVADDRRGGRTSAA